ncbi:E3 ubiquitin-protein ligase NRDP1-like [Brevipalpus obovatus]|uniref:E3 ubiquitin-protein ligase NRDP1-like n=1 Tax=Brevipalpus obovatus TaxID=246614 RepID=UPI003D9F104A
MGYDLERFLDAPDQELICSICQMVYEKPLVTPCGHTFCGDCIKEWLSKKGFCPLDNRPIRGQSALRDIPISFRNMIGTSLKIRCDHRKEGCMVISKLDDLRDHERVCPFRRRVAYNPAQSRQARFREDTQSQESDHSRFIQTVVTVFGVVLVLAAAVIFRR